MNKSAIYAIFVIIIAMAVGYYFLTVDSNSNYSPQTSTNTNNRKQNEDEWKTFNNPEYEFQFEYPSIWELDTSDGIKFKDETDNVIVSVTPKLDMSILGISFCGANPDDDRCEQFEAESGKRTVINWLPDNTAYATFTYGNGRYGVSFSLLRITPETKTTFKKLLSSFELTE